MDALGLTGALATAAAVAAAHGTAAYALHPPRAPRRGARCLRREFRPPVPGSGAIHLTVAYLPDPRDPTRLTLAVTLGLAPGEVDLPGVAGLEAMLASLRGLGEVLLGVLPREVLLPSPAAEAEAALARELLRALPPGVLRGLRRGGARPRVAALSPTWPTGNRGWPTPGVIHAVVDGRAYRLEVRAPVSPAPPLVALWRTA